MASFAKTEIINTNQEDSFSSLAWNTLKFKAGADADTGAVRIGMTLGTTITCGGLTIENYCGLLRYTVDAITYVNVLPEYTIWFSAAGMHIRAYGNTVVSRAGSIQLKALDNTNTTTVVCTLLPYNQIDGTLGTGSCAVKLSNASQNDPAFGTVLLQILPSYSVGGVLGVLHNVFDPSDSMSTVSTVIESSLDGVSWTTVASNTSYAITAADIAEGRRFRARVSFVDGNGTVNSFTSYNQAPALPDEPTLPVLTLITNYSATLGYKDYPASVFQSLENDQGGKICITSFNVAAFDIYIHVGAGVYIPAPRKLVLVVTTNAGVFDKYIATDNVLFRAKSGITGLQDLCTCAVVNSREDGVFGTVDDLFSVPAVKAKVNISASHTIDFFVSGFPIPTNQSLGLYVLENTPASYVLGNILPVATDNSQITSIYIDQTYGDYAAFNLDVSGNLRFNASPDYETKTSYALRFKAASATITEKTSGVFRINVLDVVEGTDLHIKQNGSFVKANEVWVKINNVFVKSQSIYVKQNDAWVQL